MYVQGDYLYLILSPPSPLPSLSSSFPSPPPLLLSLPSHPASLPPPPLLLSLPIPLSSPQSQRVKALYNFEPQEEGELRMRKGDIVNVVEKVDQNWWKGTCDGRSGLFPVPYVKELNN